MSSSDCRVLRFVGPERVDILTKPLPTPEEHEVRVRTNLSGVSPGTETLIYRGEAPKSQGADLTISSLSGGLEYPLEYGYAAVGRVDEVGSRAAGDWLDRRVFSFQPHTSHFVTTPDDLIQLPDGVSDADAVLIPSVETAVNLCMDGSPSVGDRAVVFGQGTIGLLTTNLLADHPLSGLYTVEPDRKRRELSLEMGADEAYSPEDADALRDTLDIEHADARPVEGSTYEGADLLYELSGKPDVLDKALELAGFASTIIVGSWYGNKKATLDLGTRFHRGRVSVKSSQVSTLSPEHQGRWSKERRMQYVLDVLPNLQPSSLITETYSIDDANRAYTEMNQDEEGLNQPVFRYS